MYNDQFNLNNLAFYCYFFMLFCTDVVQFCNFEFWQSERCFQNRSLYFPQLFGVSNHCSIETVFSHPRTATPNLFRFSPFRPAILEPHLGNKEDKLQVRQTLSDKESHLEKNKLQLRLVLLGPVYMKVGWPQQKVYPSKRVRTKQR